MKINVFSPDFKKCWLATLSRWQVARLDNGRLISCGLVIGESVSAATVKRWANNGTAKPCEIPAAKPW